jgi:hypothetical protein
MRSGGEAHAVTCWPAWARRSRWPGTDGLPVCGGRPPGLSPRRGAAMWGRTSERS